MPTKEKKEQGIFTVINEKGLHTRPSTELVKCISRYHQTEVHLSYQDLRVNAKSLLGILTLAAGRGAKIRVEAEGEKAKEVLAALIELSKKKFNIEY